MAEYKINTPSSVFPGKRGDIVVAEPGPFLNAAVISRVLSRIDVEKPVEEKEEVKESTKEIKKKK